MTGQLNEASSTDKPIVQPEDVNDGVKQVSEILVALGKDDEAMEFIVENAQ